MTLPGYVRFPELDPVAFSLGPVEIRWYALAYLAGIGLGWWYAVRLLRREELWRPGAPPLTRTQLDDLVLAVFLGILLGGRLGFALFYRPSLLGQVVTGPGWEERLALFRLWDGGMSFHGGLVGVALALVWFGLRRRVSLLSLGDLVAPVVPIGLLLGRLANFVNGELWGRETTVPWAVRFCNERLSRLPGGCPAGDVPRHPSQLYEAGLEGLVLLALLWFAVHRLRLLSRPGAVTGLFLVGYGLARAALENVRQPDAGLDRLPLGLTMGMLLSAPMVVVGLVLLWRAWRRT